MKKLYQNYKSIEKLTKTMNAIKGKVKIKKIFKYKHFYQDFYLDVKSPEVYNNIKK